MLCASIVHSEAKKFTSSIKIVLCHECYGILLLNICGLFLISKRQKRTILNIWRFWLLASLQNKTEVSGGRLEGLVTDGATQGDLYEIISNIWVFIHTRWSRAFGPFSPSAWWKKWRTHRLANRQTDRQAAPNDLFNVLIAVSNTRVFVNKTSIAIAIRYVNIGCGILTYVLKLCPRR